MKASEVFFSIFVYQNNENRHNFPRLFAKNFIPVGIYLFKVNYGNTRTMCEICLKLAIKTPERGH